MDDYPSSNNFHMRNTSVDGSKARWTSVMCSMFSATTRIAMSTKDRGPREGFSISRTRDGFRLHSRCADCAETTSRETDHSLKTWPLVSSNMLMVVHREGTNLAMREDRRYGDDR